VIVSLDGRTECAERLGPEVEHEIIAMPPRPGERLPRRLWRIGQALRRFSPDVLVTSNWGSIEWAMASRAFPRLAHLHTEDGFGPEEASGQLLRRVLARRLTLPRSRIVLPSTTLLALARDNWKLSETSLNYVPNGLDLQRFSPRGPAVSLDVPGVGPLIGTVAALRAEKSLGRLLHACALLVAEGVAFRLALVGEGPERTGLEALTDELGLRDRVAFTGHIADPANAYRAFDVFALSSSTEQMPFSVLEAMATGLPVAATDVGDVRHMLAPENQPFLAAGMGEAALAAALRPLVEDVALRARLGLANRRRAETAFDQETMFQAYAALIEGK
jgi:glycosyltransferase involved in cell wall biosynthesis